MLVFGKEKKRQCAYIGILISQSIRQSYIEVPKNPSFEKITETGVLTLGSMGFLLLVHGISLGACNFILVMEKVPAPATKAKKYIFAKKTHPHMLSGKLASLFILPFLWLV